MKRMDFNTYLENHNLDHGTMTTNELAELPFHELWPLAVASAPSFAGGNQYGYYHTPFGENLGEICFSPPHQLLWKCNWCTYWSDVIDQRVFEEHLLIFCPAIEGKVREAYRRTVVEQIELYSLRLGLNDNHVPVLLHTPVVQSHIHQPVSSLAAAEEEAIDINN
jgi:hypothetical protein